MYIYTKTENILRLPPPGAHLFTSVTVLTTTNTTTTTTNNNTNTS